MTPCSMRVMRHRWIPFSVVVHLSLLLVCWQVASGQQWQEKPQDQLVGLGNTARFVCKSPELNPKIVWTKGAVVLFVNGAKFLESISDRYTLEGNYTLKISNVQLSDNGMYGCNVQDFGSASANLTVLLPPGRPTISSDLTGDVFEEGQTVRFTCSSSGGNPPPTITWMKNGLDWSVSLGQTTTEGDTTRNVLTVVMDHSDHQANYTCFVYNTVNQNSPYIASKILNVRYSPIITFEPFSPYAVRQGSSANITCHVDANPPVNSVTWRKDGQDISGTNFVRVFSPVRREDSGNYTCIASNSLNTNSPTRNSIVVNVVYPPVVNVPKERDVPESTRVTQRCDVDANPSPVQIMWELVLPDGRRETKSNSVVLEFGQIRREDAGNYSCKASSVLRVSGVSESETVSGEAFMYINVQYPPGSASVSPVGNIDVGQRLQLTCTATPEGYPLAQFRWRRNGAEQTQKDPNFIIPTTSLSDSATYSCTPFNSVGQGSSANVTVSINEPPQLLKRLPEEITRDISNIQPLSFTCKGQGRPAPTIEWFKDNMTESLHTMPQFYTITSSSKPKNTYSTEVTSTLSFQGSGRDLSPAGKRVRLRIADLGNYSCVVKSSVHTTAPSSVLQLHVQFAPIVSVPSQKIAVTVLEEAVLPCQAQAFPQPTFQWNRAGRPVDLSSPRFSEQQVEVNNLPAAFRSTLTINGVGSADYGLYSCVVSNSLANVTSVVNVTTKSTPAAPTSLQTLGRTWDSIHLQWTPGFNGGYPQQFKVTVQELGTTDSRLIPGQPLSTTDFNITGLKPSTRYEFSVHGQNELGEGQRSLTIISQTRELEIPTLGDVVPVFHTASKQLVLSAQPSAQYCLKIDAKDTGGKWRTIKQCTRVLGEGSLEIVEKDVVAINVSVCLVDRPEVCGPPTKAEISEPDNSPALTVRDVIIIACVCAVIIITLLIILICFICRRRRANEKYENSGGIPPSASNGGVPGKKMQHGQGQAHSYENTDGRYPTFATSSEYPPNYWDSNSQPYDNSNNLSFDSQLDRQMYELELNRRNDMALYGRADGFRGQQESIGMQGRPMSPSKDKYIDLEDPNDPSLQSQESGYSTGDPNKPKKVQFTSRFGWRPLRPFARRRILSRMRKKKKSQPHLRFSHSPPGHTCGLPCCSEDIHVHVRLNAPSSRYSCMPMPNRQADLENNFTFRRNQLIPGRPTLTNKFYSLQTRGVKGRAGLPKFQDDFGIEEEAGEEEEDCSQSASAAHETLRQYRATIETDTDGSPQPYMERVALDSRSVIRTPIRYLQPWECFHKREIILPDLPTTPRRMVFLDYRPGESHDGGDEEEETIEVYTSGYQRPAAKHSLSSVGHPSSSSSSSSPSTTHSSSSSSTQTTSTSTAASSKSKPKVSYSGAVRPIPAPIIHVPPKSALKKPKTDVQTDDTKNTKCPVCQNRAHFENNQSQSHQGQDEGLRGQDQKHLQGVSVSGTEISLPAALPSEQSPTLEQEDSENLYESHVYDVLSDVAPRLLDENVKSEESKHRYDKVPEKPPPVPPTRRNQKPQPEKGRRAITPEMKRRFTPDPKSSKRDKTEERYSTFPTRRRHHHYEELTLPDTDKTAALKDATDALEISRMDIFSIDDKAKLLDNEEVEESLYEALNPAFLSDSCALSRDLGGGSLGSMESARLSHASYASYGCTCLSGDVLPLWLDDEVKTCDVSVSDAVEEREEKTGRGFLADNPITLIL